MQKGGKWDSAERLWGVMEAKATTEIELDGTNEAEEVDMGPRIAQTPLVEHVDTMAAIGDTGLGLEPPTVETTDLSVSTSTSTSSPPSPAWMAFDASLEPLRTLLKGVDFVNNASNHHQADAPPPKVRLPREQLDAVLALYLNVRSSPQDLSRMTNDHFITLAKAIYAARSGINGTHAKSNPAIRQLLVDDFDRMKVLLMDYNTALKSQNRSLVTFLITIDPYRYTKYQAARNHVDFCYHQAGLRGTLLRRIFALVAADLSRTHNYTGFLRLFDDMEQAPFNLTPTSADWLRLIDAVIHARHDESEADLGYPVKPATYLADLIVMEGWSSSQENKRTPMFSSKPVLDEIFADEALPEDLYSPNLKPGSTSKMRKILAIFKRGLESINWADRTLYDLAIAQSLFDLVFFACTRFKFQRLGAHLVTRMTEPPYHLTPSYAMVKGLRDYRLDRFDKKVVQGESLMKENDVASGESQQQPQPEPAPVAIPTQQPEPTPATPTANPEEIWQGLIADRAQLRKMKVMVAHKMALWRLAQGKGLNSALQIYGQLPRGRLPFDPSVWAAAMVTIGKSVDEASTPARKKEIFALLKEMWLAQHESRLVNRKFVPVDISPVFPFFKVKPVTRANVDSFSVVCQYIGNHGTAQDFLALLMTGRSLLFTDRTQLPAAQRDACAWCIKTLIQLGRFNDAREFVKVMSRSFASQGPEFRQWVYSALVGRWHRSFARKDVVVSRDQQPRLSLQELVSEVSKDWTKEQRLAFERVLANLAGLLNHVWLKPKAERLIDAREDLMGDEKVKAFLKRNWIFMEEGEIVVAARGGQKAAGARAADD